MRHWETIGRMFDEVIARLAERLPDLGVRLALDSKAIATPIKCGCNIATAITSDGHNTAMLETSHYPMLRWPSYGD